MTSMPRYGLAAGTMALFLALTGCRAQPGAGHAEQTVECAIGIGADWTGHCPVERDGDLLTIRHADGGFRRFLIIQNGQSVMPADGAEESSNRRVDGDRTELSVGPDRYRLPARFGEVLK
ncbi:hypothetical protein [Sphingobium chungbukense]|nr:hypothetical protein [Sphingobium chungbukense]